MMVYCLAVSIILLITAKDFVDADIRNLVKHLMEDTEQPYKSYIRPVKDENTTKIISYEMVPKNLITFDEVKQQIRLRVWLRQRWDDEFLTWNPEDFNDTNEIRIPSTKVWRPDIVLYNSVDTDGTNDPQLPVTILSNGTVAYNTPYIFVFYCKVDLTFYPFDIQYCNMPFGSWAHDITQVDLIPPDVFGDISQYQDNGEWNLNKMPIAENKSVFSCCDKPFKILIFNLNLERKPDFYIYNLILPYVLISVMSLLAFYLPPESGEKMSLSITVLLSLIVFNQLVFQTIPRVSAESFPILGKYFICMIGMVSMSVTMSVLNLHVYHREHACIPMPPSFRWVVFSLLARAVGKCKPHQVPPTLNSEWKSYQAEKDGFELEELMDDIDFKPESIIMSKSGNNDGSPRMDRMERHMTRISKFTEYLAARKRKKDKDQEIAKEWRDASAVIDRALLLTFAIVTLSLPTFFLMAARGYFSSEDDVNK